MNSIAHLLANSGLARHGRDPVDETRDGAKVVYLHAGHLYIAPERVRITTILGSCVAICMWDPGAGVGGMNHYMLPDDLGADTATPRYANYAIRTLIDSLQMLGARRARLQAKLYGGASVLSSLHAGRHLGQKNIDVGRERLAEASIPIVHEDAGSIHGRKVIFDTATGHTIVTRV